MKLLLDTHIILWLITDSDRLSKCARELISSRRNASYFSAASSWEVSLKNSSHPDVMPISGEEFMEAALASRLTELPIKASHTVLQTVDAAQHRDPFDRLLVAQAESEGMMFLTHDSALAALGHPSIIGV